MLQEFLLVAFVGHRSRENEYKINDGYNLLMSQGISSFCSAGGQGSELNNNLFPPCKVLLMNFCKH